MTPNLEVVVGTYEQFLLGYKINKIVDEYKLEQTFATHSHLASIRSVASNRHYLASAGADEVVCLYDMRYRTENGKLIHHNDSVNCITFTPDASHILTGGRDGQIGVVRCGNWQVEKLWEKPHKGESIEALAVHPSGKLALSTGGDGTLRTWNLVKGKQAYATNLIPRWRTLAKNINILKWSPNGEKYLIASNRKIDIYSVETAGVDEEINLDSKVICVEFLNDDLIAIGYDDGKISFYDLEESSKTLDIVAHTARLKCMQHIDDLLVTASSSGEIKLWQFTKDSMSLLNQVTCNSRILCLTLATVCKNVREKEDKVTTEEVVEIKKIKKLRMRQEVIIEDEEDNSHLKVKETKKKSKVRLNEEAAEEVSPVTKKKKKINDFTVEDIDNSEQRGLKRSSDDEDGDSPPKQKRKKMKETSSKKRKDSKWLEEEIEETPIKKKLATNSDNQDKIVKSKEMKENKKVIVDDKKVSPKKKFAKDLNLKSGNFSKKKKKKNKNSLQE
ncbi:p21-activated protein kinase-interacting protein 1-like [Leptopilina heterotoma]|uniref:p21-activated protein kinase-interacting protein 1-like n=1 Tax=Leptopilina heterotoma TaxID=63436 RepID=UPI001CA97AE1|nr:p21-activated protein kinase-interacting protein 1-like [Leptopilina heterotoma]